MPTTAFNVGEPPQEINGEKVHPSWGFCLYSFPVNLSGAQKELLEQLETSIAGKKAHHRPKETGFFDGVKKFFEDLKS